MRYASVCSGIEAAGVAWAPLGWVPVLLSEIAAFPRAVLEQRHGAEDARRRRTGNGPALWGDFTTIRPRFLRRLNIDTAIDLLIAGTPCQSFSVAGLRGGLGDDRGNLALEFLRLARRLRPRWLVWENVFGVLSLNGGRDFGAILAGMVELGYGVAYRVLDAMHFGVPQRRRRVFVIGYLGDWRRAVAVLFERHCLSGHPAPDREARQESACTLAGGARSDGGYSTDDIPLTAGALLRASFAGGAGGRPEGAAGGHFIAATLTGQDGGVSGKDAPEGRLVVGMLNANGKAAGSATQQDAESGMMVAHALNAHGGPAGRLDASSETLVATTLRARAGSRGVDSDCTDTLVSHTLRAEGFDASEDGTGRGTPLVASAFNAREDFCATGDVTGALSSSSPQAQAVAGHGVRRLMPVECERLQGLPDHFTAITYRGKPAADGPRYRALGNTMARPVMAWLGRRIAMIDAMPREALS
jgi:DNA (cytosine-5)-methyltransferase 1